MTSPTNPPDLIVINGRISTMSDTGPAEVEAMAVSNGLIVAMGGADTISALAGPQTRVIDLGPRRNRVIPGLIDAHCHPVKGAIAGLFACKFGFSATPEDVEAALNTFFERFPDVDRVMGGRYGSDFMAKYADVMQPSPRAWLDAKSKGRAVYLREDSGHNGWANSKALEVLGLSKDSPDPKGGKLVRDSTTGELTGILLEEADVAARLAWPDWSHAQYSEGVKEMMKIANAYGVTGVVDADANHGILKAYQAVDQQGEGLSLRVVASQTTPYGHREEPLDYGHHEEWRDMYASKRVDTRSVKIYEDGVPLDDSRSALLLEPYLPDPRFPENHCGSVHVPLNTLAKDVTELDKRGFTVKIHCCGDGSVRVALDAIEAARKANGNKELRHELSHAGLVSPQDLPRFAELNAVIDLSPYLWYPSPIVGNMGKCVGKERMDRYFPIKDYIAAKAPMEAGSDWPAGVASMDPWIALHAMVTRKDPTGKTEGALAADQAISVKEALDIFTRQGARALRKENETGSLEVGKSADFVVLDTDIFEVPGDRIGATKVEMTFFEGRLVYERA